MGVDAMNERGKPILRGDICNNGGASWKDGRAKCEAASFRADI